MCNVPRSSENYPHLARVCDMQPSHAKTSLHLRLTKFIECVKFEVFQVWSSVLEILNLTRLEHIHNCHVPLDSEF